MKYRKLQPHEIIRPGDMAWANDDINEVNDGQGVTVERMGDAIGKRADYCCNNHYRPVKEHNWISFADRKPTKEDEFDGRVLVLSRSGRWGDTLFRESATVVLRDYWMPLNFTPREPARIKVRNEEVTPSKDGSVKVGCTTIPAEDMKEIIRQYNEVVK